MVRSQALSHPWLSLDLVLVMMSRSNLQSRSPSLSECVHYDCIAWLYKDLCQADFLIIIIAFNIMSSCTVLYAIVVGTSRRVGEEAPILMNGRWFREGIKTNKCRRSRDEDFPWIIRIKQQTEPWSLNHTTPIYHPSKENPIKTSKCLSTTSVSPKSQPHQYIQKLTWGGKKSSSTSNPRSQIPKLPNGAQWPNRNWAKCQASSPLKPTSLCPSPCLLQKGMIWLLWLFWKARSLWRVIPSMRRLSMFLSVLIRVHGWRWANEGLMYRAQAFRERLFDDTIAFDLQF